MTVASLKQKFGGLAVAGGDGLFEAQAFQKIPGLKLCEQGFGKIGNLILPDRVAVVKSLEKLPGAISRFAQLRDELLCFLQIQPVKRSS